MAPPQGYPLRITPEQHPLLVTYKTNYNIHLGFGHCALHYLNSTTASTCCLGLQKMLCIVLDLALGVHPDDKWDERIDPACCPYPEHDPRDYNWCCASSAVLRAPSLSLCMWHSEPG